MCCFKLTKILKTKNDYYNFIDLHLVMRIMIEYIYTYISSARKK